MEQVHALNSMIGKKVRVVDSNGTAYYGTLAKSVDMYMTQNARNVPCFWAGDVVGVNTLEHSIEINFQVIK